MKCIVGLLTPERGELLYDNRNFLAMGKNEKKALRREMGMIFQSAALFDSMTVLDNVMFPLNMFSNDTFRDRTRRAMFCLDRVNLAEAKDKFPGEISGGMQKRVAIARAIALNPQYLFCDEPNSGLDPKTSLVIDELVHDITHEYNMTTLINTHDMNSVMGIGEKLSISTTDTRSGKAVKTTSSLPATRNSTILFCIRPLPEGKGSGSAEYRRIRLKN